MKLRISTLIIFLVFTIQLNGQVDIFDTLRAETWLEEDSFAGCSYKFYESKNGVKKAIKQIHGSGFYVIQSLIFDVSIEEDKVQLVNGLDLVTSGIVEDEIYQYLSHSNEMKNNKTVLRVTKLEYTLNNWFSKLGKVKTLDENGITSIAINKNQVYLKSDIDNLEVR